MLGEYVGVERWDDKIKTARQLYPKVTFIPRTFQASGLEPESVAILTTMFTLMHCRGYTKENLQELSDEINRVLIEGGIFYICDENITENSNIAQGFHNTLVKSGFLELSCYGDSERLYQKPIS